MQPPAEKGRGGGQEDGRKKAAAAQPEVGAREDSSVACKGFRARKVLAQLPSLFCGTETAKQAILPAYLGLLLVPSFYFYFFFPSQSFGFSLIFSPECQDSKALGLLKIIQALLFLLKHVISHTLRKIAQPPQMAPSGECQEFLPVKS